jgi:hypothetical protein
MNVPTFETMPPPLSQAESQFRSAIDDLAVFNPSEEATRDILRVATKPLPPSRYLLLQVLDPLVFTGETSPSESLIYAATIMEDEGEVVATLWIDETYLFTGTDEWQNRVPHEETGQVIEKFLEQTGALINLAT